MQKNECYRIIPDVNSVLQSAGILPMIEEYGRDAVKKQIQISLQKLREQIKDGAAVRQLEEGLSKLEKDIYKGLQESFRPDIRRVINATGTVLHTNLGRAPINRELLAYMTDIAAGYSNLEYDLVQGKRGERYSHFEELMCELTGAEAAMAVNNNAAAVLLVLTVFARGGETVVSRGELVEIGGKFRIPDVCEQSGSILKEVGTTNKTHTEDYREALSENTKVLFKAHTSNYRILGFTEAVDIETLAAIAREYQQENGREIPVIEDMGSGALLDLTRFGLPKEPVVREEIQKGADLVTFSGDKLLGGPQAGLIVGKKKYIDQIKKNPLTRALRVDKFTVAALELTLRAYQSEQTALQKIPVLQMLSASSEVLQEKAEEIASRIQKEIPACSCKVIPVCSSVGGGSMPLTQLQGSAVALLTEQMGAAALERKLRLLPVPVMARIVQDQVILDVRTIFEEDIEDLLNGLKLIFADGRGVEQLL